MNALRGLLELWRQADTGRRARMVFLVVASMAVVALSWWLPQQ